MVITIAVENTMGNENVKNIRQIYICAKNNRPTINKMLFVA